MKSSDSYAAFARLIGKTPVWVFHGDADALVPVTEARQMVEALTASGANVKYTKYPDIGHGHAGPLPAQTSEVQKA
jgi:dipeptidyl aminopeptidase/acylaminoacyl peptidase